MKYSTSLCIIIILQVIKNQNLSFERSVGIVAEIALGHGFVKYVMSVSVTCRGSLHPTRCSSTKYAAKWMRSRCAVWNCGTPIESVRNYLAPRTAAKIHSIWSFMKVKTTWKITFELIWSLRRCSIQCISWNSEFDRESFQTLRSERTYGPTSAIMKNVKRKCRLNRGRCGSIERKRWFRVCTFTLSITIACNFSMQCY